MILTIFYPSTYLIPFILFFTLIGVYIEQNNVAELLILIGIDVMACLFRVEGYPLAPLLIGFIVGRMLENDFSRSMQLYDGISFLWQRSMMVALLMIAIILVLLSTICLFLSKRSKPA